MLALALSACSDSTTPGADFDPGAVVADVQAAKAPFQTDVYRSFAGVSPKIDAALGASVSGGAALAASEPGRAGDPRAAARHLVTMLRGNGGASMASPSAAPTVPAELMGTTFVWSVEATGYVPSELPGAPANGVRFMLYDISEADFLPKQPLAAIGHLTIATTSSETGAALDVTLANASDVTYLHFVLSQQGSVEGGTVMLKGHITDLTTRADFEIYNTLSGASGGEALMSTDIKVPGRQTELVSITRVNGIYTEDLSDDFAKRTMEYIGQHGMIDIVGEFYDGQTGVLEVLVGPERELFARLEGQLDDPSSYVAKDPQGNALPERTAEALMLLNAMQYDMLRMFVDLAQPLNQFIGWYYLIL
jgi:hypothetical protein